MCVPCQIVCVYGIPVACYHERISSLCIGTVLKSKMPDIILYGRMHALVEVAEAEHRVNPWPHLARLQPNTIPYGPRSRGRSAITTRMCSCGWHRNRRN